MEITEHALERIEERIEVMCANDDITCVEADTIKTNLQNMISFEFDPYESYGIRMGRFEINPDSALRTQKHRSGTYYEINSLDYQDIIRDSTGNELWGIVRGNRLVTAFLRKTVQRTTAEKPRNQGGLGVDEVVDNFTNFVLENKF